MDQKPLSPILKIQGLAIALVIMCIFIAAAIADEKNQKAKELFSLGVKSLETKQYEEAINYFKSVLKIEPDYADAYLNLSAAYGALGRDEEAAKATKAYRRAVSDDPAIKHYNRGLTNESLNRYEDAVEAYQAVTRINPDHTEAHFRLGVNYSYLGRHTEA